MKIHFDNSAFSTLSCEYAFQQRVILGLTPRSNLAASFGDLVHKAFEFYDKGDNEATIISKLQAIGGTVPKAYQVATFARMAKPWPKPLSLGDNPAIELKFSHHYATFTIPGSSELLDIYLDGTIDKLFIDDENDILVIRDYKTTAAATKSAIDKKLTGYSLAFQLPFYYYALLKFGILPAAYTDYLISNRYRMEIMLITHNTQPVGVFTYQRQPFPEYYREHAIPHIINTKIQQALSIASLSSPAAKTGFTVYPSPCDTCAFRPACLATGTPKEDEILAGFERSVYDPLSFR